MNRTLPLVAALLLSAVLQSQDSNYNYTRTGNHHDVTTKTVPGWRHENSC